MLFNCVKGPYCFGSETVRDVDYYQVQDSYVRSEAQKLLYDSVLQQDGEFLLWMCRPFSFTLNNSKFMDWITWFDSLASQITGLSLTLFSLQIFVKDKLYHTFARDSMKLRRRRITAIKTVNQKIPTNVWMNLENR